MERKSAGGAIAGSRLEDEPVHAARIGVGAARVDQAVRQND